MGKIYIGIVVALLSISTMASERSLKGFTIGELEDGWWSCDYASTHSIISFDQAASCSNIFEELKSRKFNGDFGKFMAWWKNNKDAQYKKLSKG